MGIGIDKGAMRRLRKTGGFFLSIFACSATVVMCGRLLWVAWATHTTFMPQRRGGHWVTLEQEPGLFWAAVTIYAILFLSGPVGVLTLAGDLIEQIRGRRRRLRDRRQSGSV